MAALLHGARLYVSFLFSWGNQKLHHKEQPRCSPSCKVAAAGGSSAVGDTPGAFAACTSSAVGRVCVPGGAALQWCASLCRSVPWPRRALLNLLVGGLHSK